jgi:hypothetical protein
MANRPAAISQIEIKRSVAAVQAAGLRIGRVDIDHRAGTVTIIPEGVSDDGPNPCDRLLK